MPYRDSWHVLNQYQLYFQDCPNSKYTVAAPEAPDPYPAPWMVHNCIHYPRKRNQMTIRSHPHHYGNRAGTVSLLTFSQCIHRVYPSNPVAHSPAQRSALETTSVHLKNNCTLMYPQTPRNYPKVTPHQYQYSPYNCRRRSISS